jgi:hypothetical protein
MCQAKKNRDSRQGSRFFSCRAIIAATPLPVGRSNVLHVGSSRYPSGWSRPDYKIATHPGCGFFKA